MDFSDVEVGSWLQCMRDHSCRHARDRKTPYDVKKGSIWKVAALEPGGVLLDHRTDAVTIGVSQRELVNWDRY